MSQAEPTEPYVFQPGPVNDPSGKIYGVSGPGTEEYQGKKYTKEDAEWIVKKLRMKRRRQIWMGDL
jgi:hypothetical protein